MNIQLLISKLFILPLQVDIHKKLEEAPNNAYQIGIVIGTYLPVFLLFALAYYLYYRAKKRNIDG
ncbi:MAG: hypothetical protein L3J23_02270 [Flavobacteriaceae bacterium]|nr:hypothetical protein [Flavobacteriaceae bacterium]